MNVLVLNVGSSSIKFELIDTSLQAIADGAERKFCRGLIDSIGMPASNVRFQVEGREAERDSVPLHDHSAALEHMLRLLKDEAARMTNPPKIQAVGHRIVHGGEYFAESVLINEEVTARIRDCFELAPLHNPHNLQGYELVRDLLPHVPHVAVFDTAFHQTMPPHAYLYALPYQLYQKHKVRRYGFHGCSHRYMIFSLERDIICKPRSEFRAITMHLGNGCSIAAVDSGKSVDTSMGFTPLEGLVMGTRCGDVDAAAILYLLAKEEVSLHEMNTTLNRFSGLTGLSGTSGDVRELTKLAETDDARAQLALRAFAYRARKYLGAYHAVLSGAHYVAVAGGIGENSVLIRKMIFEGLEALGINFDESRNAAIRASGGEITQAGSPVRVFVVATDEELVIARDTVRCVQRHVVSS